MVGVTPAPVDDRSGGEKEWHVRPFLALGHSHDLDRLRSGQGKGRRGDVGPLVLLGRADRENEKVSSFLFLKTY
jgi:hypothetical protein